MSQLMAYLCDCINDTGYQKSESIHRIFIWVVMINNESTYETVEDVPESSVWWRADFQNGSRVLKKGF